MNKLFSKKRAQINKSNRKASIGQTSLRKATISNLDSFGKKELPVLILVIKTSNLKAKDINITMIGMDVYYAAYYLIKAHVFAIPIKDILYLARKEVRADTNLKSLVP